MALYTTWALQCVAHMQRYAPSLVADDKWLQTAKVTQEMLEDQATPPAEEISLGTLPIRAMDKVQGVPAKQGEGSTSCLLYMKMIAAQAEFTHGLKEAIPSLATCTCRGPSVLPFADAETEVFGRCGQRNHERTILTF